MENSDLPVRDPRRIAWGGVVIVFGLLLLAERVDFLHFHFRGQFWPFILIAPGAAKLAETPDPASGRPRRSGGWLLFAGIWALITEMQIGGLSHRTSWPIVVIGAGVAIVWHALHGGAICGRLANRGNHAA
jgi:hypothetical protein